MGWKRVREAMTPLAAWLAGCLLIAVSFNILLNPNHIASGGVPGAASIVQHYTGLAPSLTLWAVNGVLLIVGGLWMGRAFLLRTLLGTLLLPILIQATGGLPPLTDNPLLASLYGGVGTGVGLGLLFRTNGSIGGFSVLAQLLAKHKGIAPAKTIGILDFIVIAAGGVAFSPENALYALVGLFCMKRLIPVVQGAGRTSAEASTLAVIVSACPELIHAALLDRGLTEFRGSAAFAGTGRSVQLVVLKRAEVPLLKRLVGQTDPQALVLLSEASEVMDAGGGAPVREHEQERRQTQTQRQERGHGFA